MKGLLGVSWTAGDSVRCARVCTFMPMCTHVHTHSFLRMKDQVLKACFRLWTVKKNICRCRIELVFFDYSWIIGLFYLVLAPCHSWDWMWVFPLWNAHHSNPHLIRNDKSSFRNLSYFHVTFPRAPAFHSFHEHSLSTYYVPDTDLGAGNSAMEMEMKTLARW